MDLVTTTASAFTRVCYLIQVIDGFDTRIHDPQRGYMDVTLLAIHRVFSINSAEKQCTFVVRSKFYEANWATWQDL